ncbi:MAG: hypothetical protein HGA49_00170 [Eubacteriaceae bacterium]|nr:hypothetical protein [Eubacteriaceae bacterium]
MRNEESQKPASSNPKTRHLEISIKKPGTNNILAVRKMTLRDRILNAIFGDGHKMVVLVPGESVGTISITEMEVHEMGEVEKMKRKEEPQ